VTSLILMRSRPDRPRGGTALRNTQNAHALSRFGPVDVVSVGIDDLAESIDGIREWRPVSFRHRSRWDRLKTRCWLARPGVYRSVDECYLTEVAHWIRDRVARERHDVAVVGGIALASYVPVLKRAGVRHVIFDAHNAESTLHREVVARRDAGAGIVRAAKDRILLRRITAAERQAIRCADAVWAVSADDARELVRAYGTGTPIAVVPNAVDVEKYRAEGASSVRDDWSGTPITLLYAGLFGYSPNEDAAMVLMTEVLPAIRARGHAARAMLIGHHPTPAMYAAARRVTGVDIVGEVDTIVPYLQQRCVVALPIALGSGTRLKILEAFAAGRPVVSSTKGVEGIDAVDGRHLLIRNGAAATADAVIELWASPWLRDRLCAEALTLTRERYSWPAVSRVIADRLVPLMRHPPGVTNHPGSLAPVTVSEATRKGVLTQ
jgi:glycosyltransferase involved in cell wall biosynthesis